MPPINVSTSTVSFPSGPLGEHPSSPVATMHPNLPTDPSYARTSRSSLRASALEVHDLVWLAESSGNIAGRINRLYESDAVYKNTFVTATSRELISSLHALTQAMCYVRVPSPTTLVARILGHETTANQMWDAWKVWSDIGTVCETESFDGHRKSIVEHTVHFLLLGGSLHRCLRVHTILSFNEQGRIIQHEDVLDLRQLLDFFVPGGHAIQSVTTRFTAIGLAALSRLGAAVFANRRRDVDPDNAAKQDGMYSHAPDTDSVRV
ncbi:hypothetical protein FRC06_011619 [Ceratobasidium sp. 370]|nr:hypothetical protein FRC06_011619 [Ceratobasidium sp. 370]